MAKKETKEESKIRHYMNVTNPDDKEDEQTYTRAERRRIMRMGKKEIKRKGSNARK